MVINYTGNNITLNIHMTKKESGKITIYRFLGFIYFDIYIRCGKLLMMKFYNNTTLKTFGLYITMVKWFCGFRNHNKFTMCLFFLYICTLASNANRISNL